MDDRVGCLDGWTDELDVKYVGPSHFIEPTNDHDELLENITTSIMSTVLAVWTKQKVCVHRIS